MDPVLSELAPYLHFGGDGIMSTLQYISSQVL